MSVDTVYYVVGIAAVAAGTVANYYKSWIKLNKDLDDTKEQLRKEIASSKEEALKEINQLRKDFEAKYREDISQTVADTKVIADMCTKLDIIWKVFEKEMPKLAIRPSHIEMDKLLKKMSEGKLTNDEAEILLRLIEQDIDAGAAEQDKLLSLSYSFVKPALEWRLEHRSEIE